jgi:hypothetical protein
MSWLRRGYLVPEYPQAAQVVLEVQGLGRETLYFGVDVRKPSAAHAGPPFIMIKGDNQKDNSPYIPKRKVVVKGKDDSLQISGLSKSTAQSRMVGTSAPPKPAYLGLVRADDPSSKFARSNGKKMSVDKKSPVKLDSIFAAREPKTKPGPTNGVILLAETDILESVGFHSSAGRSDGRAKTNQDSFIIDTAVKGDARRVLLGVFDGHGLQGHKVSNFLVHNLKEVLLLPPIEADPAELAKALTDTAHNLNKMLKKTVFIDTKLSGSTGVMVLIEPGRITCSNVGDSRAVLLKHSSNGYTHVPMSADQKPSDPQEKQRIISHGGRVHPSRRNRGSH